MNICEYGKYELNNMNMNAKIGLIVLSSITPVGDGTPHLFMFPGSSHHKALSPVILNTYYSYSQILMNIHE